MSTLHYVHCIGHDHKRHVANICPLRGRCLDVYVNEKQDDLCKDRDNDTSLFHRVILPHSSRERTTLFGEYIRDTS